MHKHIACLAFSIAATSGANAIAAEWSADNTSCWLRVIPAGEFRSDDGRPANIPGCAKLTGWRLDETSGRQIIAALSARRSQLVVDYEHQTLHSEKNGQPAPASGWMQAFAWRENGLWALVKWTESAAKMIRADEYRYISPVFAFDKTTGAVLNLMHASLTNFPAVDGITDAAVQRAAARYSTEEDVPAMKLLAILRALLALPETATETEIETELQAIDALVKPKGDAVRVSLKAVLEGHNTAVAALTAKIPSEPVVPVSQLAAVQTALGAAQAEVVALKANVATGELDAVIRTALDEGRILPAQEEWARKEGTRDIAVLKNLLAQLPAIAALRTTQTQNKAPAAVNANQLSDTQLAVCKNLGIAPEDYAKQLASSATASA